MNSQDEAGNPLYGKRRSDDRGLSLLVISAPFGNYSYFRLPGSTATLGTYTWDKRAGTLKRVWRIASTLRYHRRMRSWSNRLGLPSPGFENLLQNFCQRKLDVGDKIVSIQATTGVQWQRMCWLLRTMHPLAVELNVSCPNLKQAERSKQYNSDPFIAVEMLLDANVAVYVKLPPLPELYEPLVEKALAAGVNNFHCCNTLPSPAGGVSGQILKPLSLRAVACLRANPRVNDIIGGGGILTAYDAYEYINAGADRVAIASGLINPLRLLGSLRRLSGLLHKKHYECEFSGVNSDGLIRHTGVLDDEAGRWLRQYRSEMLSPQSTVDSLSAARATITGSESAPH